jgi:hypothetical protein
MRAFVRAEREQREQREEREKREKGVAFLSVCVLKLQFL